MPPPLGGALVAPADRGGAPSTTSLSPQRESVARGGSAILIKHAAYGVASTAGAPAAAGSGTTTMSDARKKAQPYKKERSEKLKAQALSEVRCEERGCV